MEVKLITRTLRFPLFEANKGKLEFLERLFEEYTKAVNYFIEVSYSEKRMPSYDDVKKFSSKTFLSTRFLDNARMVATAIVKNSLKQRNRKEKPQFKGKIVQLDRQIARVEENKNSKEFQFWLAIRDPEKRKWVYFPVRDFSYRKKNYNKENGWQIANAVKIQRVERGKFFVLVSFRKEVKIQSKEPKGVDLGINKLAVDSDGKVYMPELKEMIQVLNRKKQGSKSWKRWKVHLKNTINHYLKKLVDGTRDIVLEDLRNIKRNTKKEKKVGKVTRKLLHGWIVGYIRRRIMELCESNGVRCHVVPSTNTSRTCPVCNHTDKLNRWGEKFKCRNCGFEADADFVGAVNILRRFLSTMVSGELTVPLPAKASCC